MFERMEDRIHFNRFGSWFRIYLLVYLAMSRLSKGFPLCEFIFWGLVQVCKYERGGSLEESFLTLQTCPSHVQVRRPGGGKDGVSGFILRVSDIAECLWLSPLKEGMRGDADVVSCRFNPVKSAQSKNVSRSIFSEFCPRFRVRFHNGDKERSVFICWYWRRSAYSCSSSCVSRDENSISNTEYRRTLKMIQRNGKSSSCRVRHKQAKFMSTCIW